MEGFIVDQERGRKGGRQKLSKSDCETTSYEGEEVGVGLAVQATPFWVTVSSSWPPHPTTSFGTLSAAFCCVFSALIVEHILLYLFSRWRRFWLCWVITISIFLSSLSSLPNPNFSFFSSLNFYQNPKNIAPYLRKHNNVVGACAVTTARHFCSPLLLFLSDAHGTSVFVMCSHRYLSGVVY